jgi:hypothetical protein
VVLGTPWVLGAPPAGGGGGGARLASTPLLILHGISN